MKDDAFFQRVYNLLSPSIRAIGFELVDSKLFWESGRQILRLNVERVEGGSPSAGDCGRISRSVQDLIAVELDLRGGYSLEVSSPGLNRRLRSLDDFVRFKGSKVRILMNMPVEGRSKFKGSILDVDGERVIIGLEVGEASLSFKDISEANLIPPDIFMKKAK